MMLWGDLAHLGASGRALGEVKRVKRDAEKRMFRNVKGGNVNERMAATGVRVGGYERSEGLM
jgi:hypothetical protein